MDQDLGSVMNAVDGDGMDGLDEWGSMNGVHNWGGMDTVKKEFPSERVLLKITGILTS